MSIRDHLHLLDEILANPAARTAFAFVDDGERRAALARHGFTQPGEPMHYLVRDVPERPEPPPLPTGFRYRTSARTTSGSGSRSIGTCGQPPA